MSTSPLVHKGNRKQAAQHWRGVLPIHDAAELLPRMSEGELRELGEDIKRHNLHTPVVIFTDQDGTGARSLDLGRDRRRRPEPRAKQKPSAAGTKRPIKKTDDPDMDDVIPF